MTFKFRLDGSVETDVRQIARGQLKKAIGELDDPDLDRHETVHQARKCCKKIRGLLRLVRPVFPDFKKENESFRDSAHELSDIRDSQSMLECLKSLSDRYRNHIGSETFEVPLAVLEQRREEITGDDARLAIKLERFRANLQAGFQRVPFWSIDANGYGAIEGGLVKTYRRGRNALATAFDAPVPENFHEWRKRVKYHWYHTRLLNDLWPEMLSAQCKAADDLSDILGDEHDLSVLEHTLLSDAELGATGGTALQVIQGLIDQRRNELRARARIIGLRLYAEKPQAFGARLGRYWNIAERLKEMERQ